MLSFFYPWLTYNCTSVLKGWQGNKGKVEGQQALPKEVAAAFLKQNQLDEQVLRFASTKPILIG